MAREGSGRMKYLHIVPGADDVANGMARVARLLAKEQGDAEVVDLSAVSGQSLAVSEASESLGFVESLEEVWVHGMWLPKEWAACRRVLKAGKRLVRMTHGSLSPIYLKQQGRWKKWLVGPIERYWLRKADRIVATCDAEKAWIEAYLGKNCPEIVVEDVKRFFKLGVRSQELGVRGLRENSKLHVLYLGRRHPLKGVEYLERAVKELGVRSQGIRPSRVLATHRDASKHPCQGIAFGDSLRSGDMSDREAELVVSEKDLTKSKLETSNTKPENRNIELKIVSNAFGDELEKVWDWCDVLVLPTLSENFGLVVAEALERGKRVITTDGAPAWEELGVSDQGVGVRGDELVYLRGFRDGSEAERVRLLRDALMMMV